MGALPKPLTLAEFLEWEERQEGRYEYDGVSTYAMTGGTAAHAAIQVNLLHALRQRLKGGPCRPYGSELKLKLESSIRYPDAFVVCSPVKPSATFVTDPVIVFEILSERSAGRDLGAKSVEYQATASIRRYIVLHQTAMAAEVFHRSDDDSWVHEFVSGDKAVNMLEIGTSIPLAEIYEDVGLST